MKNSINPFSASFRLMPTTYEYALPDSETERSQFFNNDPGLNRAQSRFYPHYGAGSQRRGTNIYRDGDRKGRNRKTSKAQRSSELTRILSSEKRTRKR